MIYICIGAKAEDRLKLLWVDLESRKKIYFKDKNQPNQAKNPLVGLIGWIQNGNIWFA